MKNEGKEEKNNEIVLSEDKRGENGEEKVIAKEEFSNFV